MMVFSEKGEQRQEKESAIWTDGWPAKEWSRDALRAGERRKKTTEGEIERGYERRQ